MPPHLPFNFCAISVVLFLDEEHRTYTVHGIVYNYTYSYNIIARVSVQLQPLITRFLSFMSSVQSEC